MPINISKRFVLLAVQIPVCWFIYERYVFRGFYNSIGANTNQFGEFEVNGFQSIVAITLDDLSKVKGILLPNHIKLDVDGRELEILKGSSKLLLTIETILVEIEGSNRRKT